MKEWKDLDVDVNFHLACRISGVTSMQMTWLFEASGDMNSVSCGRV